MGGRRPTDPLAPDVFLCLVFVDRCGGGVVAIAVSALVRVTAKSEKPVRWLTGDIARIAAPSFQRHYRWGMTAAIDSSRTFALSRSEMEAGRSLA